MKLVLQNVPMRESGNRTTVDTMPGVVLFNGDPSDGAVNYAGSTQVDWDGQEAGCNAPRDLWRSRWATAIEGLDDK